MASFYLTEKKEPIQVTFQESTDGSIYVNYNKIFVFTISNDGRLHFIGLNNGDLAILKESGVSIDLSDPGYPRIQP